MQEDLAAAKQVKVAVKVRCNKQDPAVCRYASRTTMGSAKEGSARTCAPELGSRVCISAASAPRTTGCRGASGVQAREALWKRKGRRALGRRQVILPLWMRWKVRGTPEPSGLPTPEVEEEEEEEEEQRRERLRRELMEREEVMYLALRPARKWCV